MRSLSPAVRYGRVPKRTREPSHQEPQDVTRNLAAAQPALPAPGSDDLDPDSLRFGVAKEFVKIITAAHCSNNIYTEELRNTLQHQTIPLQLDESDNEGKYN